MKDMVELPDQLDMDQWIGEAHIVPIAAGLEDSRVGEDRPALDLRVRAGGLDAADGHAAAHRDELDPKHGIGRDQARAAALRLALSAVGTFAHRTLGE